ncbi:cupin 2 domain-containing protein [Paucimonas lemoignei]|uniref:Cupin 2 domain-containing protein n=1 Tax=Paucimonas lemoignei TaxID=29443 RepID=A0A4R3HVW6_PAULE|nr:cupin domain-containing protein [Paucimonas lemoignei]TCS37406.1 cupin 2 domain-containing protein [Paucimonas lemoignei]
MKLANLFENIPQQLPEEVVEMLAGSGQVRIERIVSHGHSSPAGYWYDQDQHEWVVLLKGQASLSIDGRDEPLHLSPGDYVNIPAHVRHRVESTSTSEETVWLAVFY